VTDIIDEVPSSCAEAALICDGMAVNVAVKVLVDMVVV
jgi:hypothetical protein